ncbi:MULTISPECIES: class I SAM-dependent methyltransferase [unclassified Simplicispira]|uniref:class I SAM-dependent DNA methyltransferase n=1 Tax=unclassified Simplicispira TaxID=2630407 RepID=UPI000D5F2C26|nr:MULTISPECIES: methyltransferase domain-containing protein [unclassified Simplicispira]PVY58182.1 methyltransferase family protein [Simplicispira sp. 125]REG15547.1 methyltransferase family protein [Simplicispira sp. 110]
MTTPSPTHFDAAARDWDQRPLSQQLAAVPERLLAQLPLRASDHVLDFGAGTGLLSTPIAPKVAQVTALDMSAAMLQVLDEKGFANITPLQQDIFAGLPGQYHAVVSCMALHHVADTAALLRAFAAALHSGGRIALVDLYQEDGSFHGDNQAKGVQHFGFAPEALQALAEQAGLMDIAFSEILRLQHSNGRGYPLFLMTGRKP